jgi:hypothetical protein
MERKRTNLTMRLRDALRAKLVAKAQENQRSLSEEVEFRLEQSFDRQDLVNDALELRYGRRIAGLLLLFGALSQEILYEVREGDAAPNPEINPGLGRWHESPYLYGQVAAAIEESLKRLQPLAGIAELPAGENTKIDSISNVAHRAERLRALRSVYSYIGEQKARFFLQTIRTRQQIPDEELQQTLDDIRAKLGPMIDRIPADLKVVEVEYHAPVRK